MAMCVGLGQLELVQCRPPPGGRSVMSPESTKQLLRSAPYFPVADVERSATHYERTFGFQRGYIAGSPPEFAIMTRDELSIMLRLVPDAERIVPNERRGGTWDVFFWV